MIQLSVPWLRSLGAAGAPGPSLCTPEETAQGGGPAGDHAAFSHSRSPALAWAVTPWGAAGPRGSQSSCSAAVSFSVSPFRDTHVTKPPGQSPTPATDPDFPRTPRISRTGGHFIFITIL